MLNSNYSFLCNIEIIKRIANLSNNDSFKKVVDSYLKQYEYNVQVDINWLLISTSLLMSENMFKNSNAYDMISKYDIEEIEYRLKVFKKLFPIDKATLPGLLDRNNCPANPFYEFLDKTNEEGGGFYIDDKKTVHMIDSWENIKFYEEMYIQKEKYYNSKRIDGPFGCNESIITNGLIDIKLLIKRIRNAIAHSNYEIINEDCIRLFNYKSNKRLDFNIVLDKSTVMAVVDILNEISYEKFIAFENYCRYECFVDDNLFFKQNINDSDFISFIMQFDICDINMANTILAHAKERIVKSNVPFNNYNIFSSICYVMYNYVKPCCEFGSIINNYMYTSTDGYIVSDELYNKYGRFNYLKSDVYKCNYANKEESDYKENELKLLIFSFLNCCLLTTHNEIENTNISFPKIDFKAMNIPNQILTQFIQKHTSNNLFLLETYKQKITKIDKIIYSKMRFIDDNREKIKNNKINNDYFNFVLPKIIEDCELEIQNINKERDNLLKEIEKMTETGIYYNYYEELSNFIFRALRNSLAHGHVSVVGDLSSSFSEIELLFEDYDPKNNQLTFSGKIKFVDLLHCLLKEDVIINLYGNNNVTFFDLYNNSKKCR